MKDDQIIDKILTALSEADPGTLYVADFIINEIKLDEFAYPKYVDKLEAIGVATPREPRHNMSITNLGRQIVDEGGWLVHRAKSRAESLKKSDQSDLEAQLVLSNIEANKLNQRNAIFNKWSTIVNIIIGLINLLAIWLTYIAARQ